MDERIPPFLAESLLSHYGEAAAARIEAGYAACRPVTLRANPLKASPEAVRAALQAAGIAFEPVAWYADAMILPDVRENAVQALPLYEQGGVYLQSLSSMLPPLLLAPKQGESILDMCAAPGGKTTELAALSGGQAMITACERDKLRAERLRFNLERQGVTRVSVMNTDASRLDDFFRFEKILLDAPCTGSGTISLQPGEPARRMTPAWVANIVKIQQALAAKAWKLLSKGGTLVYSTCSILPQENEGIVSMLLREKDAELIPVPDALLAVLPCLPNSLPGTVTVCPDALFEGFYLAILKKK